MSLETKVKNETMKDATGKSMSTKHVLTLAIKYLVEDLKHIAKDKDRTLRSKDIRITVAVPSKSTEEAKDCIKEAVIKTKIPSTNIAITPGAQAVSMCCRSRLVAGTISDGQMMVAPGDNYMIANKTLRGGHYRAIHNIYVTGSALSGL